MQSAQDQQEWLAAMHRNIYLLQKQPGFGSINLHASLDGRNVVVYAQWNSEEAFHAAVDLPEVKAARVELDSHGEPDGALFKIDSVHQTGNLGEGSLAIELVAKRVTFVNVWVVPGQEQQQRLLAAMKEHVPALVSKPGSCGCVAGSHGRAWIGAGADRSVRGGLLRRGHEDARNRFAHGVGGQPRLRVQNDLPAVDDHCWGGAWDWADSGAGGSANGG